jgi:hypothetical protein
MNRLFVLLRVLIFLPLAARSWGEYFRNANLFLAVLFTRALLLDGSSARKRPQVC